METDFQRFSSRVLIDDTCDCWVWVGAKYPRGYGTFKRASAHRWSYEYFRGPIPDGLVLDHLCRVHACVNPHHLEVVTQAENVRRGVSPVAVNATKTHCKRGHEFTPKNTRQTPAGWRVCLECERTHHTPRSYARRLDRNAA